MSPARVLSCPRCPGVELDVVAADRHEIDMCSRCRGLWLDAAEWSAVIGPSASPSMLSARDVSATAAPECPACLTTTAAAPPLEGRTLVGADEIVLDACPSCRGAWLDGGELARLKQALAAARARPTASAFASPAAFGAPPPVPTAPRPAGTPSPDAGYPSMGQALLTTAGGALMLLLKLAATPPRRRGFFGRRRRGGFHSTGLVTLLLRLLRR